MTTSMQNSGDALVSNTMICEVSRLFSKDDAPSQSIPFEWRSKERLRVVDLMSLIEAIILHETLYTLPANLNQNVKELPFRQKLIDNGILKELDVSDHHDAIAQLILRGLKNTEDPVKVAGSSVKIGTPIEFSEQNQRLVEYFLLLRNEEDMDSLLERRFRKALPRLNDSIDFYGTGGNSSASLHADSFKDMSRDLIGWIEYHSSGAYEFCTSVLRDMYYVYTCEYLQLPYWPESTRLNFARNFPNYLNQSVRIQLYKKLAEALETTVEDIYDDLGEEIALIPPFTALVLERSSTREDIIENIFNLRDEYSRLRYSFASLEYDRREAKSIKERKKIRLEQRRLLETAATVFDQPSTLNLEGIIRYMPDVIKPGIHPLDPTQYSANLLIQPTKVLINWWQRRPLAKMFDVAGKISEIENYESLIEKIFPELCKANQYDDWRSVLQYLRR
jgi:hypothetical protein